VISIAAIALGITGCFRAVILNSTAIENSNEDDIVISTKDGRQVNFDSGQYNVNSDENGRRLVSGRGRVFRQGESQFESFEGSIPIDDIERISTSETITMFYVGIIAAATLAVGYVLLVIALNGRGFGG